MTFKLSILTLLLLVYGCKGCNQNKQETLNDKPVSEHLDTIFIKNFISEFPQFSIYEEKIINFYQKRNFRLAWSNKGEFIPQADMFINVVEKVEDYGLTKDTSLTQSVRDSLLFLKDAPYPRNNRMMLLQKNIDLVLTSEYFLLAPKLLEGLVDPATEDSIQWHIEPKKIRYTQLLDSILDDKSSSNPFLNSTILHPQVKLLKRMLTNYRRIKRNGGWPELTAQQISIGDTGNMVRQLTKRLLITNDLAKHQIINEAVFDNALKKGVENFQKRQGLKASGVADKRTIAHLNVPVEDKLKQILVNLERWRWIPGPLGENYILVNIPDYTLTVYRSGKPIESMKIIVGKTGSNTVIFQGEIKYIVVNPYWNIPKSISVSEILPQLKRNKEYLREQGMEVGLNWNFKKVNQDTINWKNITAESFNYTLRQKPGDKNPLGRIKFLFPNQFSIYLHDTPNYSLFSESERGFSHGCIRVEKPMDLADYIIGKKALSNRQKIYDLLISGNHESITVADPVPVYILYFTVWIDENGIPQFRKDIYGHDKKLAQRMFSTDTSN